MQPENFVNYLDWQEKFVWYKMVLYHELWPYVGKVPTPILNSSRFSKPDHRVWRNSWEKCGDKVDIATIVPMDMYFQLQLVTVCLYFIFNCPISTDTWAYCSSSSSLLMADRYFFGIADCDTAHTISITENSRLLTIFVSITTDLFVLEEDNVGLEVLLFLKIILLSQ